MKSNLTVLEKYSRFWPQIAVLSLFLAIIFFISYIIVTDILIEGYLRLAAFSFFAASVFSFFKVKEGQITIEMEITDHHTVDIRYKIRSNLLRKEEWALTELHSLKVDEMPNRTIYNDLMNSDRCLRFRRKNENEWMYLNKADRRVIPLSEENALKMYHFLNTAKKNAATAD